MVFVHAKSFPPSRLADHSLSYKLICKKKLKSDECQALAEEVGLQHTMNVGKKSLRINFLPRLPKSCRFYLFSWTGNQLQEKLQPLFRKKCLSNQALGRWYDICDGPFPARVVSVEVNLLNSSTETFVELLASGIANVLQPKCSMSFYLMCMAI